MLNDDLKRAIDEIKLRAPIEDVVRERLPHLKKAGVLWEACCPFHEERTPSFKVDPRRGTWRCFGACGTGGDQISFIEKLDNLGFLDALELLAARTGVEMPKRRERTSADGVEDRIVAVVEAAVAFYRSQLRTTEGQVAVRYLRERGLTETTCDAFGVGYAPASGQAFVQAARAQEIDVELALRAGLVRRNDQGRLYDFFRGRLTIPIRDLAGRAVGFGARRLSDDDESGPKYVNTGETEVFKKSRLVYALDRALPHARREGRLVLVEGYTDVMAAHQCGVPYVVAVLGTATTDDHAAIVRRTGARRVSLVFDGDEAGRKAAYKALHGLLPLDLTLEVVSLRGGIDPCDLLVRDGASAFLAELEMARGWFEFLVEGLREKSGVELSREVDRVLELFGRLSKPVHRESCITELARALELPVASLREQAAALRGYAPRAVQRPAPAASAPEPRAALPAPRRVDARERMAYEEMVGAVLADASVFPAARAWLASCPEPEIERIGAALAALYDDGASALDTSSLLTQLGDDPARTRVVTIAGRAEERDEDFTPLQLFDAQVKVLERLARKRVLDEENAQALAAESAHRHDPAAAAADPRVLEIARRRSSSTLDDAHPIPGNAHG